MKRAAGFETTFVILSILGKEFANAIARPSGRTHTEEGALGRVVEDLGRQCGAFRVAQLVAEVGQLFRVPAQDRGEDLGLPQCPEGVLKSEGSVGDRLQRVVDVEVRGPDLGRAIFNFVPASAR